MGEERFDLEFEVTEPARASDLLSRHSGLSQARIKLAMRCGAVWLHTGARKRRLRRAASEVSTGDRLCLYYNAALLDTDPPAPTLVADGEDYSVWYKPAGLICSGTRYADHHTIARWVEVNQKRPTLLVHRLDRFTRGLIVLAHSKRTARQLAHQFANRQVQKTYQAEVDGCLRDDQVCDSPVDGKPAVSRVSVHLHRDNTSLVSVKIDTGRKHQIRQHLKAMGHPVVGDRLYGSANSQLNDLQLVATELAFDNPQTAEQQTFKLPKQWRLF